MRRTVTCARIVLALAVATLATACVSASFDGPDGSRRFYEARCGACHVPFPREQFGAAEWPKILDVMAPRAGLTKSQRERVLTYVTER